jgi:ABC-2 type transport system permease protein
MNIQTKAGIKKEILAYFRTNTFTIVAAVIIGIAIISPLLIVGLGTLMDLMSDVYDEYGVDISGMTEALGSNSAIGVMEAVSSITSIGLIVFLLLINKAAGGEQKKRSVIIPRSSGLRSFGYLFPKYIIYPPSVFILAVAAVTASWFVSSLVFEVNDVSLSSALLAGVLSGVCLMLYTCFHLTLGTATGMPGMSAAVCIVTAMLLPNIFALTSMEYMFNPFVLNLLAGTVIHDSAAAGAQHGDIAVTVVFALAIMVCTYFVALFAQNARKIDNSGNEIEL